MSRCTLAAELRHPADQQERVAETTLQKLPCLPLNTLKIKSQPTMAETNRANEVCRCFAWEPNRKSKVTPQAHKRRRATSFDFELNPEEKTQGEVGGRE